jgi:hypothetical protein
MFHASEDTNGASMPGVICASMPLVAASISVPPAPVSRGARVARLAAARGHERQHREREDREVASVEGAHPMSSESGPSATRMGPS